MNSVVERDQIERFLDVYVPLDFSAMEQASREKMRKQQDINAPTSTAGTPTGGQINQVRQELELQDIYKLIPEREPGLRISRAVICEIGGNIQILAPFAITEEMCAGHMPGFPILPLAEAGRTLAQVGAILVAYTVRNIEEKEGCFTPLVYKVGEIVSGQQGFLVPNDKVCLVAQAQKLRGPLYFVQAHGYLGEKHIFSMPKIHYFISQDQRLWGLEV